MSSTTQAQVRCTQICYIAERGVQVTLGKTLSIQLKSKRPHETHRHPVRVIHRKQANSSTSTVPHDLRADQNLLQRDLQHAISTTIHKYESRINVCSESEFCMALILLAKNTLLDNKNSELLFPPFFFNC